MIRRVDFPEIPPGLEHFLYDPEIVLPQLLEHTKQTEPFVMQYLLMLMAGQVPLDNQGGASSPPPEMPQFGSGNADLGPTTEAGLNNSSAQNPNQAAPTGAAQSVA